MKMEFLITLLKLLRVVVVSIIFFNDNATYYCIINDNLYKKKLQI